MTTLQAYIGRDFEEIVLLEYKPVGESDYETIPDDTATQAIFRFGAYCIDTDDDEPLIEFQDSNTKVAMKLGLIDELKAGQYTGYLTIYDATNTNGLPWEKISVRVWPWPICPEVEAEP
jgi:hypothetical protein